MKTKERKEGSDDMSKERKERHVAQWLAQTGCDRVLARGLLIRSARLCVSFLRPADGLFGGAFELPAAARRPLVEPPSSLADLIQPAS